MTDIMEMLEGVRQKVSRAYAQAFDEQIYRIFGPFPNSEEVARRGRIFKHRDTEGFYDEFRLDDIPQFQQRMRINDGKISIEIKRC